MLEPIPTIIIAIACYLIGRNSRRKKVIHHRVKDIYTVGLIIKSTVNDTLKIVKGALLDNIPKDDIIAAIDTSIEINEQEIAVMQAQQIIDK